MQFYASVIFYAIIRNEKTQCIRIPTVNQMGILF